MYFIEYIFSFSHNTTTTHSPHLHHCACPLVTAPPYLSIVYYSRPTVRRLISDVPDSSAFSLRAPKDIVCSRSCSLLFLVLLNDLGCCKTRVCHLLRHSW